MDSSLFYVIIVNGTDSIGILQKSLIELPNNGDVKVLTDGCQSIVLVAQCVDGNVLQIQHSSVSKTTSHNMDYSIPYDGLVDREVMDKVTEPLIGILTGTPPTGSISKITELELLEVLAHHHLHKKVLLKSSASINQAKEMIRLVVQGQFHPNDLDPLAFVHCLAACQLLIVLASPGDAMDHLPVDEIVPLLLKLLYSICDVWVKAALKTFSEDMLLAYVNYCEMIQSIARSAILVLYQLSINDNCLTQSTYYIVWAVLLCSGSLSSQLEVAASTILVNLNRKQSKWQPSQCCSLSLKDRTPSVQLSSNLLQIRSDDWTFESIRATHCVGSTVPPGVEGWYYEVKLHTSGIIQLGWATENCQFTPQKGLGVGDNHDSVAFDGERCRKWHGILESVNVLDNRYGDKWHQGDILQCMISSTGDVSYGINGKDLGIAFSGMDLKQLWYPAVSLASGQQVEFNFGSSPFSFCPPGGYLSMHNVSCDSPKIPSKVDTSDICHVITECMGVTSIIPDLYYEVRLSESSCEPETFGFCLPNSETLIVASIDPRTMILELPEQQKLKVAFEYEKLTIGVGYMLNKSSVAFTVNGKMLKTIHPLNNSDAGIIPYFGRRTLDINFGTHPFKLYQINDQKHLLKSAALLMDLFNRYH